MTNAIPPDFTVPEALRPVVDAIRNRYSLTADVIAGELYEAGLPHDQANTVAVDMLIEWACELAMITAVVLGGRQPQLARWQEVTGETFERVAKRYADLGVNVGGRSVNAPITLEIDCLATARRILSTPDAVYSATPFEIVAMAACTVRESSGTMPDLPVIADRPTEQLSASIAAAVARLLRADRALEASRVQMLRAITVGTVAEPDWRPIRDEFDAALTSLQTTFEKEFPNGSDL